MALWRSLLEERAGVRSRRRFTADAGEGKGSLVDVSTRTRGPRELFLFLTSFFAGSSGALDLDLPAGRYTAVDALTGQALPLALAGGQHRLAVALPAFGSRVVRVTAASGKPFAGW